MNAYTVHLNGKSYLVTVKERRGDLLTFSVEGEEYSVSVRPVSGPTPPPVPSRASPTSGTPKGSALTPEIKAPLPGIISDIKVSPGDTVAAGATLVVIEAMKMENPIKAPSAATVLEVHVTKGQEVAHATLLLSLKF
jgi:glutaconyl-CoA/methylmalonyl-CoA decarboxylase subunit gamma